MRTYITIGLIALAGLVAGCGGQSWPRAGSVTKMTFIPSHDTESVVPVYTTVCSGGATVTCTQILTGMIPVTEHHSDSYEATIYACDESQRCGRDIFEVDAATFGTLKIGTWFDRDDPSAPRNI